MFSRLLQAGKSVGSKLIKNDTALLKLIGASVVGLYGYSCIQRVPLTNRVQFLPYPYIVDCLIGRALAYKYKSSALLVPTKHESFTRIDGILKKLKESEEVKACPYPYFNLFLVDALVKNFLSFPGGGIVVFQQFVTSESEYDNDAIMASLLAHEMGHVLARHQCEGATRIYGTNVGLVCSILVTYKKYGVVAGLLMTAGALALKYMEIRTRHIPKQQKELEADYMAMKIMAFAGYDPTFAIKMMEIQCSKLDSIPMFSSHPPSKERLKQMKEHLAGVRTLYKLKQIGTGNGLVPAQRNEIEAEGKNGST